MTEIDKKLVDRVRKLLALAADGGATEAEAALAAERARFIMAEHGIAMATVVASGGSGEARADEQQSGGSGQYWQFPLMEAICATCFVHCERTFKEDRAGRRLGDGYRLIGRESAVATARVLFEYLDQTVARLTREQSGLGRPKWFRRGMSERLSERIRHRHAEAQRAQRQAAETQRAGNAASGSTALVVVLEDYARAEQDLNNDLRRGVPPGTTARERAEDETAEVERKRKFKERYDAAVADGATENVAWFMGVGYDRAKAEELARPREEKPESEAEKERRHRRETRWREQSDKEMLKRASPEWQAGRRTAETVGLDQQMDDNQKRRLT